MVPGQHRDHRAEVDPLGARREVREELRRVADHEIRRRVLLHRPQRVEAERLDEIGERGLLLPDLVVGDRRRADLFPGLEREEPIPVRVVLERERYSEVHGVSSFTRAGEIEP